MFERFTESARRTILFARYEASQYGSTTIDTEHLLLGLLREDKKFVWRFLSPTGGVASIRTEIEKRIVTGQRISTSVEMPLSSDAKKVLNVAADEAARFGHSRVGTEHLFLGLLKVERSLAAEILQKRGLKAELIEKVIAINADGFAPEPRPSSAAVQFVENFLAALKQSSASEILAFFARNARIVDCKGRLWAGIEEIEKACEALFAPYSKKTARFIVETPDSGDPDSVIASILWENVIMPRESTHATHRMTIVVAQQAGEWAISLLQVTPVATP